MTLKFKLIAAPTTWSLMKIPTVVAGGLVLVSALISLTLVWSTLLGAILALLPATMFARRVFSVSGARMAQRVTANFYRAETEKFLLTAVGFAVVFATVTSINVGVLFATYMIVMVVCWVTSYCHIGQRK